MGNVNFKKWEMPNINEDVRLSSPQVLLAEVETGSAIWDGNLVIHGEIKHILHDLSIQFLGMQLKRSMTLARMFRAVLTITMVMVSW